MHNDIQTYIDQFKRNIADKEIESQELEFDELSPEEDKELTKFCDLSDSLVRQSF